jgi:glycosyltransferase involved in cell wall biosynthesis
VISTRHGGIPDVVRHGETGLLVEEGDVAGMAGQMLRLLHDPAQAAALGRAARRHVSEHFSSERSIGRLWAIIEGSLDLARH